MSKAAVMRKLTTTMMVFGRLLSEMPIRAIRPGSVLNAGSSSVSDARSSIGSMDSVVAATRSPMLLLLLLAPDGL